MSSAFPGGAEHPAYSDDILDEPTLDDILADPLVGLILRRDRLSAGVVRAELERERRRLAGRSGAPALRRAA